MSIDRDLTVTDAEEEFETVPQFARRAKVSVREVQRWIAAGELAVYCLGRAVRIRADDRERFLAARRHGGRR